MVGNMSGGDCWLDILDKVISGVTAPGSSTERYIKPELRSDINWNSNQNLSHLYIIKTYPDIDDLTFQSMSYHIVVQAKMFMSSLRPIAAVAKLSSLTPQECTTTRRPNADMLKSIYSTLQSNLSTNSGGFLFIFWGLCSKGWRWDWSRVLSAVTVLQLPVRNKVYQEVISNLHYHFRMNWWDMQLSRMS